MAKHVLLALRDYRRAIHEAVAAFAHQAGWQLEFSGHRIMPGWYGDGIIADDFTAAELAAIRNPRKTFVVVRNHLTGPRIRQVHGDAKAIALMAFKHFRERGYTQFATADELSWKEDPAAEFESVVRAEGYPVQYLQWRKNVPAESYADAVKRLCRFLKSLPKPSAVLIPGLWAISHFYRACLLESISIPQDVALLVNNDDPLICESFTPSVSSIAGQIPQLGWAMAELLDDLMSGRPNARDPVRIGPDHIVARQSTDMLAVHHAPTARAVRHMLEHYGEPITVSELAAEAGMSVVALERHFVQDLGKLPRRLLCALRMERACELLATTDLPLRQIAAQVGYGSAMSLFTAFRREFSESPGTYREREQARRPESARMFLPRHQSRQGR